MNLHILSDPVSDFWKCPKKGFKKKLFTAFFSSEFYRPKADTLHHHPLSHMRPVWQSAVPHYEDDFESRLHYEGTADCKCLKLAIDDSTQTVLYCTVLWSTIPSSCHITTISHLKNNTHIWAGVPTGGGGSE